MTHKIRVGDWIIFEAAHPLADLACEDPVKLMHRAKLLSRSEQAAGYALHVLDATKTHLTVFNPLAGSPEILQLSLFDGDWHYASAAQVDATWVLARKNAHPATLGMFDMTIKSYPYKPLEGPRP